MTYIVQRFILKVQNSSRELFLYGSTGNVTSGHCSTAWACMLLWKCAMGAILDIHALYNWHIYRQQTSLFSLYESLTFSAILKLYQ